MRGVQVLLMDLFVVLMFSLMYYAYRDDIDLDRAVLLWSHSWQAVISDIGHVSTHYSQQEREREKGRKTARNG